jgi:hypothetical protein
MNTCYRSIVLAALISVCGVHHVSGFTQPNTDDDRDERRSSQSAVRVYVAAQSAVPDSLARAPNMTIAAIYLPVVDSMLSRSPTFRRQSARIAAAAHLSVEIRGDLPAELRLPALTRIVRRPDGNLQAIVFVGPTLRAPELIAHELEHIIEQLDGVDLRIKSRLRATGVHQTRDQHLEAFETRRATVTGLRVASEFFAKDR